MSKYLEQEHNHRGLPEQYHNRTDLDTMLKERGMAGLYPKGTEEKKELHQHLVKRAQLVGREQAIKEVQKGKMFNQNDSRKI
jgi:hypothetical protein